MIRTLKKVLCAVAVMASHGWATENTIDFTSQNFSFTSVKEADRDEFNALCDQHNAQPNVPNVTNIFDNHLARRAAGNAWHMLMVRNLETSELVAALSMGRIPSVVEKYNPEEHAQILAYFQTLNIINEDKVRIDNNGIGHYIPICNMKEMRPYLTELHENAFLHCCRLSQNNCLLPIEKTNAVVVGLFVRPDAPDQEAMIAAGYTLTYAFETAEMPNDSRWYADKTTEIWTRIIEKDNTTEC